MIRKILHCIDEDKPIKAVDLKDAIFMAAKSWDSVSPTTIKNCWRKAGFPELVVEPTHDPFESDEESDEEGEGSGLWNRVVQQYPSLENVPFGQFGSLDQDVVTENPMTEIDAEREALESVKPLEAAASPQQEEDSDDDVSVIESMPLTPMQAIEAVKVIRDFVITLEEPGERERNFLSSLSAMEDAFLRLQITTKRQTRLNEYFQQ